MMLILWWDNDIRKQGESHIHWLYHNYEGIGDIDYGNDL